MIAPLLMLQAAALPFDLAALPPRNPAIAPACATGAADEVIVCARRRSVYRLPLPDEARSSHARVRGEPPRPDVVLAGNARCGIFAGERACSKREAADYGYGNGRDPITVAGKIVGALAGDD